MKKIILVLSAALMVVLPVFADKSVTIEWGSNSWTGTLPDEVASLVEDNMDTIVTNLKDNNVTEDDVKNYADEITDVYNNEIADSLGTTTPYTTAVGGLNDFSDALKDTMPNIQIQQNVWANSWIGYLVQVNNGGFVPRFGLGANVGAAKMDISPLLDTASAFKMDMGGVPETLVMPTITFDARVGGVKVGDFALPFDFGFTLSGIDSSKLGLDETLKEVSFDYFSIGFDIRYCVWEPHVLDTKVSVGAGYYFTKASVKLSNDDATAGLDFKSSNFTLNGQISTKLAFFRPFAGLRLMFTNSSVDWYAENVNWTDILGGDENIAKAVEYGFFPSSFRGGADGFKLRPVIQGGFAFDLAVIDLTFSGSYDFSSDIWGAAFSLRFSL